MHVVTALFGIVNYLACVLTLIVFFLKYRQLKKEGCGLPGALDAYEFVEHSMLVLWWLLGIFLILALEINPFWILAWFFVGLVLTLLIKHLAHVSGLIGFMCAGEMHLRAIAQEMAESTEIEK